MRLNVDLLAAETERELRTLILEVICRVPDERRSRFMPPLLFVHGTCHAAWCWDVHFLDYFAQHGYRAFALSLRGHGASAGVLWRASIDNYVEDVARVVDSLGEVPIVIGHSMGGLVVQKYLENHRACAGVLMASVPPRGMLRGFLRVLRRYPLQMIQSLLQMRFETLIRSRVAKELFFSPDIQGLETYVANLQGESFVASLNMLTYLPKPSRITVPVCVLGATKDALMTSDEIDETARAYRTQAHMFDMAHDMMLETGWEAVAECIRLWLACAVFSRK